MSKQHSGVVTSVPRVLVVDDDGDWREVLTALFQAHGYAVMAAANGLEALQLIDGSADPPDAIVLDLVMPVMNGWELMSALRSRPGVDRLPVIVTSATHDPRDQGLEAPFLRKPFDLGELLALVAGSVRARRPSTEYV